MDYEKAYNEALERARHKLEEVVLPESVSANLLQDIFPELFESEDERIRKMCITAVNIAASADGGLLHHEAKQCLDWLEKQKENPKSADFIPSDCVSDAKCENRWHKTANSLPDDGRDVLAKDALGNYLLASFDGAQWFVSVYDGQDHPVLHTPPILEWCDIETCEESLHTSETCKENADSFTDEQKVPDCCLKCNEYEIGYKAGYEHGCTAGYNKAMKEVDEQKEPENTSASVMAPSCWEVEQKEQKPALSEEDFDTLFEEYYDQHPDGLTLEECGMFFYERGKEMCQKWSDEDERILKGIIGKIDHDQTYGVSKAEMLSFLEGLRPSWKPSEEQMEALRRAVNKLANTDVADSVRLSIMYDNLKKL